MSQVPGPCIELALLIVPRVFFLVESHARHVRYFPASLFVLAAGSGGCSPDGASNDAGSSGVSQPPPAGVARPESEV